MVCLGTFSVFVSIIQFSNFFSDELWKLKTYFRCFQVMETELWWHFCNYTHIKGPTVRPFTLSNTVVFFFFFSSFLSFMLGLTFLYSCHLLLLLFLLFLLFTLVSGFDCIFFSFLFFLFSFLFTGFLGLGFFFFFFFSLSLSLFFFFFFSFLFTLGFWVWLPIHIKTNPTTVNNH